MRWLAAVSVVLVGCAATVGSADSGDATDVSSESTCPPPPATPTYDCNPVAPDVLGCGPWNTTASAPHYPLGCVVTTTIEGTFCGPVTCNCTTMFADGGAQWICPL